MRWPWTNYLKRRRAFRSYQYSHQWFVDMAASRGYDRKHRPNETPWSPYR